MEVVMEAVLMIGAIGNICVGLVCYVQRKDAGAAAHFSLAACCLLAIKL